MSLDKKALKASWQRLYKAGLEADVWGQSDEAVSAYTRLAQALAELAPELGLSARELLGLQRFRHCLQLRAAQLRANAGAILDGLDHGGARRSPPQPQRSGAGALSLDDMKRIAPVLDTAFTPRMADDFPVALSAAALARLPRRCSTTAQHSTAQHSTAQHSTAQHSTAQHSTAQRSAAAHRPPHSRTNQCTVPRCVLPPALSASTEDVISVAEEKQQQPQRQQHGGGDGERGQKGEEEEAEEEQQQRGGSLRPPPVLDAGLSSVSLHVSSVGLKDASEYVNPFVHVLVTSARGPPVEAQATPFLRLSSEDDRALSVDCDVHLSTSLERMASEGLTVFLELRHWKAAKRKVSTRCFALLEPEELRTAAQREAVALELYKKPTDWSKKRLGLLSVKPLYLHLAVTITQH